MGFKIVILEPVEDWLEGLTQNKSEKIDKFLKTVQKLERSALGTPYLEKLRGTDSLFEIRVGHGNNEFRLISWIDTPDWTECVVLHGGDKVGDDRFYEDGIAVAERNLEEYQTSSSDAESGD